MSADDLEGLFEQFDRDRRPHAATEQDAIKAHLERQERAWMLPRGDARRKLRCPHPCPKYTFTLFYGRNLPTLGHTEYLN